jgi:hypothetical protein
LHAFVKCCSSIYNSFRYVYQSSVSPKLAPTLDGLINAEIQQQANVLESAQQLQEAIQQEQQQRQAVDQDS